MGRQEEISYLSQTRQYSDLTPGTHSCRTMTANFSYPQTEPQSYQPQNSDGRDSLGSNSSAPGMVEDTSSETSADADNTTSELWNSFFSHTNWKRPAYPAVITEGLTTTKEGRPSTRGRTGHPASQHNTPSPSPCSSGSERSQTPKASKGYKLFPAAVAGHPHVRFPVPPSEDRSRKTSLQTPSSCDPLLSNDTNVTSKSSLNDYNYKSSAVTSPALESEFRPSSALSRRTSEYSCEEDIPILSRDYYTPPHSPRIKGKRPVQTQPPPSPETPISPLSKSPTSPFAEKSLPGPQSQPWVSSDTTATTKRRPSLIGLRNVSLSKLSTRSTPSLTHQAKSQVVKACSPLSCPVKIPISALAAAASSAAYMDRPLPPLPSTATSYNPTPPNISVFEVDSDDEDEENSAFGSENQSFTKRLMRGLALSSSSNPARRAKSDAGLTYQPTHDQQPAAAKSPSKFSSWGKSIMRGRAKSTAAGNGSNVVSSIVAGNTAAEQDRHFKMLMSLSMGEDVDVNAALMRRNPPVGLSSANSGIGSRPGSSRGGGAMSLGRRIFGGAGGR
ncbi:hypothetical protein QBC43DRAFT_104069 [Cladorrhinum sp. PSN259]|nr:hypothetical protein QBC43DRAFT_104069 [Cladorrhinum sp. PSN259]